MEYTLTLSADNFGGTSGNDTYSGSWVKLQSTDKIAAGAGVDTLVIGSSSDIKLDYTRFVGVTGIDILDLSAAISSLRLSLNTQTISQADDGMLLVKFGANAVSLDTDGNTLGIQGTGLVKLTDSSEQKVVLEGTSNGNVEGGIKNDTIQGGAGNDKISGGGGLDVLSGGKGSDTLTGGANSDRFVYSTGDGQDKITDFDADGAVEVIDLRGVTSVTNFSGLSMTQSGNNTILTFSGSDKLTLEGVKATALTASDFIFKGQSAQKDFYFKAGVSVEKIQEAIDDAPAGSTIHLAAGTYNFTKALEINRNDIKLVGAGEGKTNIIVETDNKNATAIHIGKGVEVSSEAKLASTATAGSNKIVLDRATDVKVGDVIYIGQANDRAWLDSQGDTFIKTSAENLREMLAEVTSVNGKTVTLSKAVPYTFEAGKATVEVREMIKNVEVGGFSVTTDLGAADPYLFENTLPDGLDGAAIEVLQATGVKLHNIAVTNAASHGFSFQSVFRISGDTLSTVGSHNKGGDGNGYAFAFGEAFENTFTHLTDKDMRHSVLFSSYSAEHYNYIQVDSTNRDINFHGSPDSQNTVIVDRSVLDYNTTTGGSSGVSPGAKGVHPNSTIEANNVTFGYFRGTGAVDKIYARASGSDMDGGYAADELIGAAGVDKLRGGTGNDNLKGNGGKDLLYGDDGNDLLDGGSSSDVLTGGKGTDTLTGGIGADTFVLSRGDGEDTVTDFQAGTGGDRLDLSKALVASLTFLSVKQVGSDTLVSLGGGDMFVLKGVSAAALKAENFVFSSSTKPLSISLFKTDIGGSGGNGDDVFSISTSFLADHKYDIFGGAGRDTLLLSSSSAFRASTMGTAKGIDVIDVSKQSSPLALYLNKSFAGQADKDYVTINVGSVGARIDTGDITDATSVRIQGSGLVTLFNTGGKVTAAGGAINVLGGSAADIINGGSSSDKIDGGKGDDRLIGNSGNDTISGGNSKDFIQGGSGADKLTGGTGADVFSFISTKDSTSSSRDTITDFKQSEDDIINLQIIDANSKTGTNDKFKFIGTSDFHKVAGELRYSQSSGNTYVSGDTNGDGKVDFQIKLSGEITLTSGDFLL